MAFSDALKLARKGGVPLLEHLQFPPLGEWSSGGMDWQVRWAHTYIYVYIYMYNIYIYIYILCVCVCVCVCIHTYMHAYIHTHTHTHMHSLLLVWPSSFQS